jgi:hypothetical protein
MSEPALTTAPFPKVQPPALSGSTGVASADGPIHRIDAPHLPSEAFDSADPANNPLEPPVQVQIAPVELSELAQTAPPAVMPRLEADQIAAYLRDQYHDLDRREQRLTVQLAQFDQERRELRLWAAECQAELNAREQSIAGQEAALAERAKACLALEAELKDLNAALLRERHGLNAEREQFMSEREEDRRQLERALTDQTNQLEQRRRDYLAEHEDLCERLKQEQLLLDNRHRFQQEHLERKMREFEAAQQEFRREQQLSRMRLQETASQITLRGQQLDRLRTLLLERQKSIERERHLLLAERQAFDERARRDKEELRRQRSEWETERDTQKADLRRQQDMLAVHAENLETRRQRLDQLRAELEETNRQTLEMRLAVEEAYAQLSRAAGPEATRARVDEARAILVEYYRHTRDSLTGQRHELETHYQKLLQQRAEFRKERQVLVDWVAGQEEELCRRERALHQMQEALEEREARNRGLEERWTRERLEAESVIRDLLRQLTEFEERQPERGAPQGRVPEES